MKTNSRYHSPETRAAVVAQYAAGQPSEVIAERFGIAATSVTNWARKAGVKVRSKGGRPVEDEFAFKGHWVRDGLVWRPVKRVRERTAA